MNQQTTPRPNVNAMLGAAIKARRIELGFSQQKIGDASGITFQQVQKYEKGTNAISVSRLLDIANALYISPIELIGKAFGVSEPYDRQCNDRQTLEMMKRYHELAPAEKAGIIAFMKTLSCERRAKAEAC